MIRLSINYRSLIKLNIFYTVNNNAVARKTDSPADAVMIIIDMEQVTFKHLLYWKKVY